MPTGRWVRVAKWLTLGATYVMNTWASYAAGTLSGIVLHSVPPLMVFAAAEAVTDLRDKLTDAVTVAVTNAVRRTDTNDANAVKAANADARAVRRGAPKRTRSAQRTYFADYLAEAREAWRPGVQVTPSWVREATGCSRGLSSRLASALAADVADIERGDAS